MRIGWATPWSTESAIGRVSSQIVAELATRPGVSVEVLHPYGGGGRNAAVPVHEIPVDHGEAAALVGRFDHLVLHLGNHSGNHRQIHDLLEAHGGLAVVHDVSMLHLVYGRLLAEGGDVLRAELMRWYGSDGSAAAEAAVADPAGWPWEPHVVEHYTFLEYVLQNARGVLTHSEHAATRVRRSYPGEVAVARLPAPEPTATGRAPLALSLPDDVVLILQAGSLSPNKQIPLVVRSFARSGMAGRAHLVVCGADAGESSADLRHLAEDLGIAADVSVLGQVSDDELSYLRARAEVATVLRSPITEAASAVLVDSLQAGLAVITINDGCYAEVGDGVTLHLAADPAEEDLAAALADLVLHPQRRRALQDEAVRWVEHRHTATGYADVVLDCLTHFGAGPRRRRLAADLGSLAARIHAAPDGLVVDLLAETATELFSPRPRVLPSWRAR